MIFNEFILNLIYQSVHLSSVTDITTKEKS